jgi:hypothetical protein
MLPKLRLLGRAVTELLAPVPETETCCGLLGSLSVKFSVAVRVPEAIGLKRMLTVQVEEPARLPPQPLL